MPQGRGLYQRRVAVVHIPMELKPYVEAEGEKIGAFTLVETMQHILTQYFHITANPVMTEAATDDDQVVSPEASAKVEKEGKDATPSHEPFVPYLRPRPR